MKVKELISTIRNELNSITLDDRKSNRFIFSKVINYANIIIKRESDSRRLFNSTEIYKEENIKLHEVDMFENIFIKSCKTVNKSIKTLPNFYSSIYGGLLNVYSLDNTLFKSTTVENYKNISNREFKSKDKYYWITNDYLVIPDGTIKEVKIRYIPKLDFNLSLSDELYIPNWLIADIIKLVVQDLRGTLSIPKDENPDMNSNVKS